MEKLEYKNIEIQVNENEKKQVKIPSTNEEIVEKINEIIDFLNKKESENNDKNME